VKRRLKSLLMRMLALGDTYPTQLTDKSAIQSLMDRLSPLSSARKLIRLGPAADGGYLLPDDLDGIEACFSPGVSYLSGFEKECAQRGMKVFLADRSVEQPAESHPLFHFTRKHVGVTTNADFMTMDDWVHSSLPGSQADLLLQIDVEGYEYETFLGISDALARRFRIIAAEFHELDQLWNQPFFRLAARAFDKILQTHSCVHIHPNNCAGTLMKDGLMIPSTAEFTFLRNDRIVAPSYASEFPHPLDRDNCDGRQLRLAKCWHRLESIGPSGEDPRVDRRF
jgi:methyltransferase FkbM-like protein